MIIQILIFIVFLSVPKNDNLGYQKLKEKFELHELPFMVSDTNCYKQYSDSLLIHLKNGKRIIYKNKFPSNTEGKINTFYKYGYYDRLNNHHIICITDKLKSAMLPSSIVYEFLTDSGKRIFKSKGSISYNSSGKYFIDHDSDEPKIYEFRKGKILLRYSFKKDDRVSSNEEWINEYQIELTKGYSNGYQGVDSIYNLSIYNDKIIEKFIKNETFTVIEQI